MLPLCNPWDTPETTSAALHALLESVIQAVLLWRYGTSRVLSYSQNFDITFHGKTFFLSASFNDNMICFINGVKDIKENTINDVSNVLTNTSTILDAGDALESVSIAFKNKNAANVIIIEKAIIRIILHIILHFIQILAVPLSVTRDTVLVVYVVFLSLPTSLPPTLYT